MPGLAIVLPNSQFYEKKLESLLLYLLIAKKVPEETKDIWQKLSFYTNWDKSGQFQGEYREICTYFSNQGASIIHY